MRKNTLSILLTSLLGLAAACPALLADVKPAMPFTDHMVLQRDMPVPVWGTAAAGEQVTVSIAEQKKTATADKDGNWALKLDPMPAGGPFEMGLQGAGDSKVTLKDVLVGEVWLCSGQSNMQWASAECGFSKRELAKCADNLMRFF